MSYCVNCGVELERSLKECPLCHTPVLNPKQPYDPSVPSPYPKEIGQADPVHRSDTAILSLVVFGTTAAACLLLNLFVFRQNYWSFYIVGACILLWIFCIPIFVYRRLWPWLYLFMDGAAVALYLFFIYQRHPGRGWFFPLGLPITLLVTAAMEIFWFYLKHMRRSILATSVIIFSEAGILCVCIELLIRNYTEGRLYLSWSAVVLICCGVITAILLTIIKRASLREEVRRRMHL